MTKLSLTRLMFALALTVATVIGTSAAFARHGADDPAGHNANDTRGEGPGHP